MLNHHRQIKKKMGVKNKAKAKKGLKTAFSQKYEYLLFHKYLK